MSITEELPTAVDGPLVLGRYRLGRRLGAGGFGSVHAAVDERLGREVAVKVIPADGRADERARREAHAAARLDHPGIVAIHDAGEEPGARYLVSELVHGRTLAQLEADGALSDRDVLRIGVSLADALVHAHERGVVHRDVKPHNVMVPDRGRTAAKLTDFGVAHLAGDDPLTRTGDVVGTLAYMAPEQARGERVDERADLYSLALVLYEALAGRNPVRMASPAATANKIGTVLPALGKQRKDLPPALTTAIDRALRPRPEERGDLDDLADALEDALPDVSDEGGTVAPLPFEEPRPQRWTRPAAALAAGALVGAALALGADEPIVQPAAAAVVAALVTFGLPRLGWLASAAVTAGLVAADHPGTAAVLVLACAAPPLLAARGPRAWSLPVLAPLLGLAGLAGAFPALAGRARRWDVRAGIGAAGAWWLLLAEPVLTDRLLWGRPDGVPGLRLFDDAASVAVADVVAVVVTSGAVALIALWGAAAALLPVLVRGRTLAADVVAATVWSATLAAATASLAAAIGASAPRGLVLGAVAAGVLAVWPPRGHGLLGSG